MNHESLLILLNPDFRNPLMFKHYNMKDHTVSDGFVGERYFRRWSAAYEFTHHCYQERYLGIIITFYQHQKQFIIEGGVYSSRANYPWYICVHIFMNPVIKVKVIKVIKDFGFSRCLIPNMVYSLWAMIIFLKIILHSEGVMTIHTIIKIARHPSPNPGINSSLLLPINCHLDAFLYLLLSLCPLV